MDQKYFIFYCSAQNQLHELLSTSSGVRCSARGFPGVSSCPGGFPLHFILLVFPDPCGRTALDPSSCVLSSAQPGAGLSLLHPLPFLEFRSCSEIVTSQVSDVKLMETFKVSLPGLGKGLVCVGKGGRSEPSSPPIPCALGSSPAAQGWPQLRQKVTQGDRWEMERHSGKSNFLAQLLDKQAAGLALNFFSSAEVVR